MTEFTKLYLDVSYVDKDMAKYLGARWDPTVKLWFIPNNRNTTLLRLYRARKNGKFLSLFGKRTIVPSKCDHAIIERLGGVYDEATEEWLVVAGTNLDKVYSWRKSTK